MSEGEARGPGEGAQQSTDNGARATATMEPETRERLEGLLKDMVEGGSWGYKTKSDPTEREVAFQSEAMAEKLFSYLYADDPTNAKKKWQQYTSKAADKGLIARAESLILEDNPNKALATLQKEQKTIQSNVEEFLGKKEAKTREQQISSLRISLGDSEHRQRQLRRSGTDQIFAEEREVDGIKLVGSFMKGATRVADDFNASWREGRRVKDYAATMKEIAGGVDIKRRSDILETFRGPTEGGFQAARDGMNPSKSSIFTAAGMKSGAMHMASVIMKMTGAGRRNAEQSAPEAAKQLLLPAPGKHFKGPGFQGPEMGLSA